MILFSANSLLNFDFLDDLTANSHLTASQSTLNQFGSTSSVASQSHRRNSLLKNRRHTIGKKIQTSGEHGAIDKIADAQKKTKTQKPKDSLRLGKIPENKKDTSEALTPINEFEEDGSGIPLQESKLSFNTKKSTAEFGQHSQWAPREVF